MIQRSEEVTHMEDAQIKQYSGIVAGVVVIIYLFIMGKADPDIIGALIFASVMPSAAGPKLPELLIGLFNKKQQ
jgi:hypothetical protein